MREILQIGVAALFGLLFGFGLIVSQMTDPKVITDFLDFAGDWNPSLLLVMAAGVVVAAPAFALARRGHHPLLGGDFALPDRLTIDRDLLVGAGIFGLGWGLAGICPGPGLVLLGTFDLGALIFVPAVIAGSFLTRLPFARLMPRS